MSSISFVFSIKQCYLPKLNLMQVSHSNVLNVPFSDYSIYSLFSGINIAFELLAVNSYMQWIAHLLHVFILLTKKLKFDLKDMKFQQSIKSTIFLITKINSCKNSIICSYKLCLYFQLIRVIKLNSYHMFV